MAAPDDRPPVDWAALIERNTRAFERNEAAFERNEAAFARNEAAFARSEAAFARSERAFARREHAFERALERNTRAWGHTVAALTTVRQSLEDMRADIRAHTQATLRMLDRFDTGEQPG